MLSHQRVFEKINQHWFYLVAVVMIAGEWILVRTDSWRMPLLIEAGVIGDLAIILPILYFVCYRQKGKSAIVRALALSCSAIWVCGYIIPQAHHHLLTSLSWLRYLGMAAVILFELRLMILLYRSVFKSDESAEQIAAKIVSGNDMPLWLARLISWEAAFWRKTWQLLKRMSGY